MGPFGAAVGYFKHGIVAVVSDLRISVLPVAISPYSADGGFGIFSDLGNGAEDPLIIASRFGEIFREFAFVHVYNIVEVPVFHAVRSIGVRELPVLCQWQVFIIARFHPFVAVSGVGRFRFGRRFPSAGSNRFGRRGEIGQEHESAHGQRDAAPAQSCLFAFGNHNSSLTDFISSVSDG